MKTYHIYLLRHGVTQGNEEGRYVGRLDFPLSPQGERQLRELKQKYYYPNADMYFSSPKIRCLQSLKIFYPDIKPRIAEDLAECDFGDYEGKLFAGLKGEPEYQKWASGGADAPPNGESSKKFQLRSCKAFERIVETLMRSGKKSAVIMAHGGNIMSILGAYGFPRRPMYEWMTGSGTGFEILITPQLWMSGKAVEIAGAIPLEPGERNAVGFDEYAGGGWDEDDDDYDDDKTDE